MNLGQIRTYARKAVGNPTTVDVPDATLNGYINLSISEIAAKYGFLSGRTTFALSTVANTQNYTLPTDCFAVREVYDTTNNVKLTKRGEKWDARQAYTGATPAPSTDYIRYGNVLKLWPIPDNIYALVVYYQQEPVALVNDTDVPILPTNWHPGIIFKTRWYYYDLERTDIAKAQAADTSFSMWVATMPTSIDQESVDIDSGVEIPTLDPNSLRPRLDFDHAP